VKEVHALADHIRHADRNVSKTVGPHGPRGRDVWVSPFLYGKIRDGITEGSWLDGKTPSDGYPDFPIHVLGFRVHRDEKLGPADCRIVIRTAT
jgi:hypothetical protein